MLQSKLLTAIEDGAVRRLGGTRAERVDVALIAATSVDLRHVVADGRFREDLYHRLAVIAFELPRVVGGDHCAAALSGRRGPSLGGFRDAGRPRHPRRDHPRGLDAAPDELPP